MFATAPISEGEVVARIPGVILTTDQFRRRIVGLVKYNAIQVGEDEHLFDDSPDFEQGFLNHSCDSNLAMGDAVTIVARRGIAAGEELTIDYALFSTLSEWRMEGCRCGTPVCRGVVTGDDWKRLDVQQRYVGQFSPFINARIARQTG